MKPRLLVTILVLIVCKPLFSQTGKTVHPVGCKVSGRDQEVPSDMSAAMASFLSGLQAAIKEDHRDKVAGFMHYPLLAGSNKPVHVHSAREFIAGYDRLFPVDLRELILRQKLACIGRVGDKGFTIGNGELWFDEYEDGKVRAFTINPVTPE